MILEFLFEQINTRMQKEQKEILRKEAEEELERSKDDVNLDRNLQKQFRSIDQFLNLNLEFKNNKSKNDAILASLKKAKSSEVFVPVPWKMKALNNVDHSICTENYYISEAKDLMISSFIDDKNKLYKAILSKIRPKTLKSLEDNNLDYVNIIESAKLDGKKHIEEILHQYKSVQTKYQKEAEIEQQLKGVDADESVNNNNLDEN